MKRTWALGLCIILLTLSVVGYNIQLQKTIILQEAHRSTSTLVNTVTMDLERIFSDLNQTLTRLEYYLTSVSKLEKLDPPSVRYFIDNQILENTDITGLSVIDNTGQILYWDNSSQKVNVGEREYFRAHQSGQIEGLYIGLPKQSLINQDQWIFGNSKALYNKDQSLSLVLSAIIDVNHLYRQYQSMFTSPGLSLTISSPAGQVYTSIPDHEELVGRKLPDFSATRDSIVDNDQELSIRKKTPDYPFIVTVTRDKATAIAPWKNIALSFAILGVVISLVVFFLTQRVALYQGRQMKSPNERHPKTITDPLTQLFNRTNVLELAALEIKKARRRNSSLSIILLDLDHFKEVNKKYGHEKGDEVLVGTATILNRHCRETDTLSRFGGEMFLLLLPDTDLQGAISNARKICKSFEQELYDHITGAFSVTASFGVAQWSPEEDSLSGCLQRAEDALSTVKKNGCNSVRWAPSHNGNGGSSDLSILLR